MASVFGFSNGLVEIAALTALIGATTAESLVLGSRGAAGLPWAAMSAFGALFLVKACIAASTPDWLRDTIGVRNERCDAAIGLCFDLDRTTKAKGRRGNAEAVGVSVRARKASESEDYLMEDIYAFDTLTRLPLRACVPAEKGTNINPFAYVHDADFHRMRDYTSQRTIDLIALCLSSLKLVEVYVLWNQGSIALALINAINWAYFFVSAVLLEILGLSREFGDLDLDANIEHIDILAGTLPTTQVPGKDGKILLGVPITARHNFFWRSVWGFGALFCTMSIILTYTNLSKESQNGMAIWLGFQVLWLALRSIYFHFAERSSASKHSVELVSASQQKSEKHATRLLALGCALSKYQTLTHPRGHWCYEKDTHSPVAIRKFIKDSYAQIEPRFKLPERYRGGETLEIYIAAVIGDTTLSSISWISGLSFTGMDLYDSCLVVMYQNGQTKLVSAARVLSGPSKETLPKDIEDRMGQFVPRGGSNDGVNMFWVFWIPCDEDKWLHFRSEKLEFSGIRTMSLLSGAQITKQLSAGELLISLTHVGEVEDIVEKSREAGRALCNLVTSSIY